MTSPSWQVLPPKQRVVLPAKREEHYACGIRGISSETRVVDIVQEASVTAYGTLDSGGAIAGYADIPCGGASAPCNFLLGRSPKKFTCCVGERPCAFFAAQRENDGFGAKSGNLVIGECGVGRIHICFAARNVSSCYAFAAASKYKLVARLERGGIGYQSPRVGIHVVRSAK